MYLWDSKWKIYIEGEDFVDSDYDEFEGSIKRAEADIERIVERLRHEINAYKPSFNAEATKEE